MEQAAAVCASHRRHRDTGAAIQCVDVAVVGNFTGVCTQPYQWQGYSQSVQYSSDTYTLARSVLRRWYDGETGNIPAGSVFMEVTEHGLKYRRLFRDTESVKIYFVGYGTPPDKALHST